MKINKYLPFAILFFFLNTTGLPHGLTYMTLLAPILYVWVLWENRKEPLWPFLLVLAPFALMHVINGVDEGVYIRSVVNLAAVYIFVRAFFIYAKKVNDWHYILFTLLLVNFILCLVAIVLYYTPWHGLVWIDQYLTDGFSSFRRLRLFTYEASYYAVLFAPVFFYFFLKVILNQNRLPVWLLAPMLILPYLLSFSMGVLACLAISISLLMILYAPWLLKRKAVVNFLVLFSSVLVVVFVMMGVFFPDNPLFVRIENILTGHDSSGKGRTSDAFMLVKRMISLKSDFWGIGFGQIKVLGEDIVRNYYNYDNDYAITIPNASAETLAVIGWIGWWLRLLVIVFFFFYTKVWRNYYRFLLFTFIFVYQFTGSFITSQIEYVIWIMAFTNVFPTFDLKQASTEPLSTKPTEK
jgi:hypothetical protein